MDESTRKALLTLDDTLHGVTVAAIAAAAHMANRAYCIALGDFSQPTWGEAPQWQKDSAIAGVEGALRGATPAESHASWLEVKTWEGWVWGSVKDPEKMTHPCMVPYEELPEAQKMKDAIFVTTVRCMAAALGMPFEEPA